MLLNITILSLSFLCAVIYGYCTQKWLKLWWPTRSYSAHALFLSSVLLFILSILASIRAAQAVFSAYDQYTAFTLSLIVVLFLHSLVQLALSLGYFSKEKK